MKHLCVVFLALLFGRHACLPPAGLVLYHRAYDIDENDLGSYYKNSWPGKCINTLKYAKSIEASLP